MRRFLAMTATLAVVFAVQLVSIAPAHANPDSLEVCCAWNESLSNNDLTYTITGGDAAAQTAMVTGIEAWETELSGKTVDTFTLTRVFTRTGDIDIRFKPGGGQIQGLTTFGFERGTGLLQHVRISVSGKAFGIPNADALIEQITKHESGHALGLGHADFDGDLMSTTIANGSDTISPCDIDGVLAAEKWRFVDDSSTPALPEVDSVPC
jgi:Matrixin